MFDGTSIPRGRPVQDARPSWIRTALVQAFVFVALLALAIGSATFPRLAPAYIQPGPGPAGEDAFALPF